MVVCVSFDHPLDRAYTRGVHSHHPRYGRCKLTSQARTTIDLAMYLADNGAKYIPNRALGRCVDCSEVLSADDVLTVTGTFEETGRCDRCSRLGLEEDK